MWNFRKRTDYRLNNIANVPIQSYQQHLNTQFLPISENINKFYLYQMIKMYQLNNRKLPNPLKIMQRIRKIQEKAILLERQLNQTKNKKKIENTLKINEQILNQNQRMQIITQHDIEQSEQQIIFKQMQGQLFKKDEKIKQLQNQLKFVKQQTRKALKDWKIKSILQIEYYELAIQIYQQHILVPRTKHQIQQKIQIRWNQKQPQLIKQLYNQ